MRFELIFYTVFVLMSSFQSLGVVILIMFLGSLRLISDKINQSSQYSPLLFNLVQISSNHFLTSTCAYYRNVRGMNCLAFTINLSSLQSYQLPQYSKKMFTKFPKLSKNVQNYPLFSKYDFPKCPKVSKIFPTFPEIFQSFLIFPGLHIRLNVTS